MKTFIKAGVECLYVPGHHDRRPLKCLIRSEFVVNHGDSVFEIVVNGAPDPVLGTHFFGLLSNNSIRKNPDKLVFINAFFGMGDWEPPTPGPVEHGFLCDEAGLHVFFPNLDQDIDQLLG